MTGHAGIVRSVGWAKNDLGAAVFRAIVEYPNGPPGNDLPFDVIWKERPVKIVVQDALASAMQENEK